MTAVDILETQRYPAMRVIAPEEPRYGCCGRKRRHDLRFTPVDLRRVRVCLLADGFQEDSPPVAQTQARRKAW